MYTRWFQNASIRYLALSALCIALGGLGRESVLVTGAQPLSVQGTIYVTGLPHRYGDDDGVILKLLDAQLGLFSVIIRDSQSWDIACSPDGHLYYTDWFAKSSTGDYVNGIWRSNQDGTSQTIVGEWSWTTDRLPSQMAFASNGDLYWGTISPVYAVPGGRINEGSLTQGVWRIQEVLRVENQFRPPQQILPPQLFTPPPKDSGGAAVLPFTFLNTGPYAGDLLIIDDPIAGGSSSMGENLGARVVRALHPDFTTIEEFIHPHLDPDTGKSSRFSGGAMDRDGELLLLDYVNNKILQYAPDGALKNVFANLANPKADSSNRIAIGPDDLVYVTVGGGERGFLSIFDATGKLLASSEAASLRLSGVTVCAPR